jgi:hypothetical protein
MPSPPRSVSSSHQETPPRSLSASVVSTTVYAVGHEDVRLGRRELGERLHVPEVVLVGVGSANER